MNVIGMNEKLEEIKINLERKQLLKQGLSFFRKNVAHIEIIRDNKVIKIFFPILPLCKCLPKATKENFHEKVNRTSTKTKLAELMKVSKNLIKIMKHEERLRQIFQKQKIIGF